MKLLERVYRQRQFRKLKEREFEFLFDSEGCEETYVCFDCETTGLNPKKDKVVSLSAIKIRNNQVLTSQALNLMIRQDAPIAAESIVIHRIRNTDLSENEDKIRQERQAVREFLYFIQGCPLVGYYLEFDVAMINQVIKPWLGITLPNPRIEVSELYYDRRLQRVKHSIAQPNIDLKFDAILDHLEIPNLGQHDAFSDALMTALIFLKLQHPTSSL